MLRAPGAWVATRRPRSVTMPITRAVEPITADDEALRAALEDAFLPALLPALAQATGDLSLLRDDLRPSGAALMAEQCGMTPQQQAVARDLAFAALRRLRDQGATPSSLPH